MSAKMLFPNSGPIHRFWGLGGRRIFCGDTIPIHMVLLHHMEDIRMQLKVGEDLQDIVVQEALTFFCKAKCTEQRVQAAGGLQDKSGDCIHLEVEFHQRER